jgi:hypothetical protein
MLKRPLDAQTELDYYFSRMPIQFAVIRDTELGQGAASGIADPAAMDLTTFHRLLNLGDVAQVKEWLGPKAARQRWRTQVRLFRQFHGSWGRKGLRLARERMHENSCPLDRQLREAAEFGWLWSKIAAMAALHFSGVPREAELRSAFGQLRAICTAADSGPIRQPLGA